MSSLLLHTTKQWESVKPNNIVYNHVFYSAKQPGKVLVVHGFIKKTMFVPVRPGVKQRKDCYLKAVWNYAGQCRLATHALRAPKYDIPLQG